MIEPVVIALKRVEAAIARQTAALQALVQPPPKHGAGIPPWHMWGGTQAVDVASDGGNANTVQGQLMRISYKRPETWHWLFAIKMLDGSDAGAGELKSVTVRFDLTVGIGRSVIVLNGFETLSISWGPIASMPTIQRWSTEVIAPARSSSDTTENICDDIVAQDIQLGTRITYFSTNPSTAKVEVQAQFAPATHIRPEWHLHHFPGGEE